ncbi:MAG TPA: hypothetical protein VF575_03375 [Candidatus Saccharimonadales bacterium]
MKKLAYNLLQRSLRKLIDWLMTAWLWANKREKQVEESYRK